MVDFLNAWLKEIILLILLAAFLDLLLPNSVMHRYVKMVMGLLLLMTIVSPVFLLLRQPLSLEKLSYEIFAKQREWQMQDLAHIEDFGNRLLQNNEEQAAAYVERQIGALIKEQVEKEHAVKVASVSIRFGKAGNGRPYAAGGISKIELVLEPVDGFRPAQGGIKPVEPVRVDLNETHSSSAPLTAEQKALLTNVRTSVAREWNVPPGDVQVTFEGEGGVDSG
ncbi:hypothetical protein BSNK01_06600 [Bacillaceae bacterium]